MSKSTRSGSSGSVLLAPGAASPARLQLPGAAGRSSERPFPPPDEHVVEPETYQEMIDGQVVELTPAEPPHADRQFDIAYVLRAHVANGYVGSTELLTRVSEHNDFATDACIRRRGMDADGHRYLEEMSFEVKYTQSEANLKKRARYLIERGVRRVFAIYVRVDGDNPDHPEHVHAGPVKEWSAEDDSWVELPRSAMIKDPCLSRPLKVCALIEAVEADNAVGQALIDRNIPVVLKLKADVYDQGKTDGYDQGKSDGYDQGKSDGYDQGKSDGYDQGKSDGYDQGKSDGYDQGKANALRDAIRTICRLVDVKLGAERNARLDSMSVDELQRVLKTLESHRRWPLVPYKE